MSSAEVFIHQSSDSVSRFHPPCVAIAAVFWALVNECLLWYCIANVSKQPSHFMTYVEIVDTA